MRRTMLLFMLLSFVIVLAACGGGGGGTDAAVETNEANAIDLALVATDWEFDQEEYVVSADQPINFSIVNDQGYHEYTIKGLGITVKPDAPQQYKITEPGTYTIECSFPCGAGHSTMTSTLVVQ